MAEYGFEMLFLLELVSLLLLQHFSIYLWNTDHYTVSLVGFTALLLSKRIAWKFLRPTWIQSRGATSVAGMWILAVKLLMLAVPLLYLLQTAGDVVRQYEWRVWLYLAHPLLAYAVLFGGTSTDAERQWALSLPPHSRSEAILGNFKRLSGELLFGVLEAVYYVSLMPLKFVLDDTRHFSWSRGVAIAGFAAVHVTLLLVTHVYQRWWRELHGQAARLGAWEITRRSVGATTWTKTQSYPEGSLVRHRKKTYVALGRLNSAEPGSRLPYVFWHLFRSPVASLSVVIGAQAAMLVPLVGLVLASAHWHSIACWATLLVLAYASLAFQTTVRRGIHHGMRALRQVEQAEEAERQRSRPAGVGDADEARAGSRGVPSGDLLPHGRSRDS